MNADQEAQGAKLSKFVAGLQKRKFWGKLEVDMKNGNILAVATRETHKLDGNDGETSKGRGPQG